MLMALAAMASCASVPMAPPEQDAASKRFVAPPNGLSGLYVYRYGSLGSALKKTIWIDDVEIGETARNVYFHRLIPAGRHVLFTESEFGNNELEFTAIAGKNHFFRQYLKFGVFVGGSNLEAVTEEAGKAAVLELGEAVGTTNDTTTARYEAKSTKPAQPAPAQTSDGM